MFSEKLRSLGVFVKKDASDNRIVSQLGNWLDHSDSTFYWSCSCGGRRNLFELLTSNPLFHSEMKREKNKLEVKFGFKKDVKT